MDTSTRADAWAHCVFQHAPVPGAFHKSRGFEPPDPSLGVLPMLQVGVPWQSMCRSAGPLRVTPGAAGRTRTAVAARPVAPGDQAVIQRKLAVPAVGERVFGRPRLERLLAMLVNRYPVVWVAATAGAGKTTAVVEAGRSSAGGSPRSRALEHEDRCRAAAACWCACAWRPRLRRARRRASTAPGAPARVARRIPAPQAAGAAAVPGRRCAR